MNPYDKKKRALREYMEAQKQQQQTAPSPGSNGAPAAVGGAASPEAVSSPPAKKQKRVTLQDAHENHITAIKQYKNKALIKKVAQLRGEVQTLEKTVAGLKKKRESRDDVLQHLLTAWTGLEHALVNLVRTTPALSGVDSTPREGKPGSVDMIEALLGRLEGASVPDGITLRTSWTSDFAKTVATAIDSLMQKSADIKSESGAADSVSKRLESVVVENAQLKSELQTLRADAAKKEGALDELRVQLESANDVRAAETKRAQTLEEQLGDLQREQRTFTVQVATLQAQLAEARANAAAASPSPSAPPTPSGGTAPSAVVNELKEKLENAEKLCSDKDVDLKAKSMELERLKEVNTSLSDRVNAAEARAASVEDEFRVHRMNADGEIAKLYKKFETYEKADKEIYYFEGQCREMRDRLEQEKEKFDVALRQLKTTADAKIAEIEEKRQHAIREKEASEAEMAQLQGEVKSLTEKQDHTDKLLQSFKVKEELAGQKTREEVLSKLAQLRDQLQAALEGNTDERVQALMADLEAQKELTSAFESEMEMISAEFETLQSENMTLVEQVKSKDDSFNRVLSDRIRDQQQVSSAKAEVAKFEEKLREREQRWAAERKQIMFQAERAVMLENEMRRKEREVLTMVNQIQNLERNFRDADAEVMGLRKRLDLMEEDLKQTKQRAADDRKKCDEATAERKQAVDDLSITKEKLQKLENPEELAADERSKSKLERDYQRLVRQRRMYEEEIDSYKQILRCPVCHTRNKSCILTRCNHMFCRHCIDEAINGRNRKCPTCKLMFDKREVADVYLE